jgi:hypothetical protein
MDEEFDHIRFLHTDKFTFILITKPLIFNIS